MFSVGLSGGGDSNPQIKCNIIQLIKLFPTARFELPIDEIRTRFSRVPPGVDPTKYCRVLIQPIMDPITKKNIGSIILPTHQIFNNPSISITPSLPLVKQPAIASSSRPPLNVPPISILPVSCESDKSSPNSKETQKNAKRTAPYQISDRTIKKPRLSITKPTKPRKDYNKPIISNQVVNHQNIKKNDTVVSSINAATCIPSTSNAVIRSSQEIACVQSSKEEFQLSKPELNCKEDSSHLNVNKNENGILMKYFCITDNQCKFDGGIGDKSGFTNSNQEMIRIQTKNEIYEITRSKMMDEVLFAVGMAMKKTVTKEELETLKQNSNVLQSPKLDWSSDTKNVTATSSKTSPANHNNISNSKNQSNQVSINKSQKHTINTHQPSKQTVKIPNITKQQSASSTVSPKMQHSTIKPTDIRHIVTNNQFNNTSLKQMATTKHIQTSNKQKLNSKQLPIASKPSISTLVTPKKVASCNVKPTVTYQSPVKDVTKCIKCKVVSEDEVCAACRMASHLKNVTVTRIETPSTSAIIAPENPIITPIRPIDVPSSSTNSVSPHDSSVLILSSDEEDDNLEPIITKVETTETLKKHVDKLTLNPKLLEDRLWQKDLSVKDYFKIEECYSVHIGSFETIPAVNGDMLVCLHGIRMVIRNLESEPVTIDLQMDNVVKILGSYGEKPLIIIYTDQVAAVGIQYLLNMNENDKNYIYDPLSKDGMLNKIVWYFNLKRNELSQLEKLLLKLPKNKYGPLTVNQANKILGLNKKTDEEAKKCDKEEREIADSMVVLLEDKLSERIHKIKVLDYKMLSSGEFLNDILMEFYMDYVYTHELSEENRKRSCIFSTYFYTALSKSINLADYRPSLSPSKIRHERVKKWTKHVDIFKKDFIFIPINENAHWYLAVICYPYLSGKVNKDDGTPVNIPDDNIGRYQLPPYESTNPDRSEADPNVEDLWLFDPCSTQSYVEKHGVNYETDVANYLKNRHTLVKRPCILLFDSLSGGLCRARVTATLRDWLEQEYIAKYNDETKNFSPNIFKASLVKVPQQPNFYDCGLFALYFFKLFFEKPIVDYTFPISHLENWFHPDDVSKNNIKRRELNNLILARMKERGSVLPVGFKLPILDLTTIKTLNTSQHPTNLHRITHPSDISNSINLSNRQNSSNFSYLSNRHNLNPAHNPPKPSTSQNHPKHPNLSSKFQHYINRNKMRHQNNHHYCDDDNEDSDDDSIESIDDVERQYDENNLYGEEDVDRQFDENDQYDEEEPYEDLHNQAEYLAEMAQNIGHDDDREEDLEHFVNEPPFNEFHRNMLHPNNGNVPYGNNLRAGPGNHRGVAHPNENFQLLRPDNHDVVYNNDDEYDEIVDEDDDEDEVVDEDIDEDIDEDVDEEDDDDEGDEFHHNPNHNSDDDEDDYPHAPNPIINHHRHDIHFNHNRRLN
ncbi:PREDICTED: uncharacterized protein LOC107173429 isoform X2 [Diuraphis noxia]|uniref:uncharacterized protein LOC107173429 isoform X2 n=1 Tax=Diuraphis noxia TaxID=143948 RepID=UPI000763B525|nr:PREDICTED: uncharacterized protein LOC107173429 isoform X2 [Diuraphis noxia]